MLIGGFGLGICACALVLSRIAQRTNGSILASALWHATYNMTSATAARRGVIAAVTTTAQAVGRRAARRGRARALGRSGAPRDLSDINDKDENPGDAS